LLRKIDYSAKTRVNAGFPCIFEKFEYDCFGGRNLRVWFESYLRSHSFNGLAESAIRLQSVYANFPNASEATLELATAISSVTTSP